MNDFQSPLLTQLLEATVEAEVVVVESNILGLVALGVGSG